jgi:hypothetical protein
MKPLEAEHRGWKIKVSAHPAGQRWAALVEAWAPGQSDKDGPQVVPFHGLANSEREVQAIARTFVVKWIDRQPKKPA